MNRSKNKITDFNYKISPSGKTLTITGTGVIPLQEDILDYPWNNIPCKRVIISEGIWEIPNGAISFPEAEAVLLPDSMVNIDDGAFNGMLALKRLHFGKYVMNIEPHFFDDLLVDFDGNEALREFTVDKNNLVYTAEGGVLYTKDMKTLISFPVGKQVKGAYTVKNGVEKIAPYAFGHVGFGLHTVKLPTTVRSIGEGAFAYSHVKRVVLSPAVKVIPECAFMCCRYLEEIKLPVGVKFIGPEAFASIGLTSIVIPEGVEHIEQEAFCSSSLGTISLPSTVRYIGRNAFAELTENWHRRYTLTVQGNIKECYDRGQVEIEEEGNELLLKALTEGKRR